MCVLKLVNHVQHYAFTFKSHFLRYPLKFFIFLKYMCLKFVLRLPSILHICPFRKAGKLLLDPQEHVRKVQRCPPPTPRTTARVLTERHASFPRLFQSLLLRCPASQALLPRPLRLEKLLKLAFFVRKRDCRWVSKGLRNII